MASNCCNTSSPNLAIGGICRDNLLGSSNENKTTCPVIVGNSVSRKATEAAGLFHDYDVPLYHFCGAAFDPKPAKFATNAA